MHICGFLRPVVSGWARVWDPVCDLGARGGMVMTQGLECRVWSAKGVRRVPGFVCKTLNGVGLVLLGCRG